MKRCSKQTSKLMQISLKVSPKCYRSIKATLSKMQQFKVKRRSKSLNKTMLVMTRMVLVNFRMLTMRRGAMKLMLKSVASLPMIQNKSQTTMMKKGTGLLT